MKKWMLEKLVCPECRERKKEVRLAAEIHEEDHDDIMDGALICMDCQRRYPIRNGVAVLLPDRSLSLLESDAGYNSRSMLSAYLWSHFADLFNDPDATEAYRIWSSYFGTTEGTALDIGCSVGRLSLELSRTHDRVIGIDASLSFIRKARDLAKRKRLQFDLVLEGRITEEKNCELDPQWQYDRVEFIVADALSLPFSESAFSTVTSVNVIEKVSEPLQHLREINRVLRPNDSSFMFSDPFSWDEAFVDPDFWISGRNSGKNALRGPAAMRRLFSGEDGVFDPPFKMVAERDVAWKIRKTANLWEHINSQLLVGRRNSKN